MEVRQFFRCIIQFDEHPSHARGSVEPGLISASLRSRLGLVGVKL